MIILYGIPNCDSVKKARAWFATVGAPVRFHDFRKDGVPPQHLDRWLEILGWEAVLNRRGTTWRGLDEALRTSVCDRDSARAVLLSHPSVIKRPVVEWSNGGLTVGFDAAVFARQSAA